jgi:ribosomal protein L29
MNDDAKALRIELAYTRGKLISNEILYDQIAELEKENANLKKELTKLRSKANVEKSATENTAVVSGTEG